MLIDRTILTLQPINTAIVGRKLLLSLLLALMIMVAAPAQAQWTLWWRTWQDSELSSLSQTGGEPIQRDEFAFAFRREVPSLIQRIAYVHEPLLVHDGEPAHNGYFHRLDYTLTRDRGAISYELLAGVHGSSNMYNHAQFHDDALVVTGQARYLWEGCQCQFGANGDYRFGHFRLYPTFGFDWRMTATTELTINLPYQIKLANNNQQWNLAIERYGNKWGALDSDREVESAYYLEEWQVNAQYQIASNLYGYAIALQLGVSFDTTIRYLDLVSGALEEDLERAYFFGLVFSQ